MPYGNRKNYSKKVTKNRKYNKKSSKTYENTRAPSIQRMDLVQPTRLMECVFDQTYVLKPNGSSKSNTFGLCFNLTDLFNGPAATVQPAAQPIGPYWGAVDTALSSNQSGQSNQSKPNGFTRYIGDGGTTNDAPYRNYMVVGGKYDIRAEQIHRTGPGAPEQANLTKCLAMVVRKDRNLDELASSAILSTWQNFRDIKQVNMTALAASNVNRPSSGTNQQGKCSGTFSAKKWFDVKDIKDNLNRLGGSFNDVGTYIRPEEDCFLQIAFMDRLHLGDDEGYVMPDILVRFKYRALVLCTETNQLRNIEV